MNDTTTRRALLKSLGALGLGAVTVPFDPRLAFADTPASVGEQCRLAFEAARRKAAWRGAFGSIGEDQLAPIKMSLQGRLPPGLKGTLYRNGPAGLERAGVRYQHWFDGDGMVQAFRIDDGGITHQGRKVHTKKYLEERAAGRFLYGGAGSYVPRAKRARDNDVTNPANISVVPYDGRLLALWEAGSPHALDPKTLATERAISWSAQTARMPFSAHPVVDPDGGMWNFGLAQWVGNGVLILYRIEAGKGLTRTGQVPLPFPGYIHSFAATATKLVVYVSPNVFAPDGKGTYVTQHQWRPKLGGRILIVDKADFSRIRWVDAPAGFVFHMVGATETPSGDIRFQACWHRNADVMNKAMAALMCGDGGFSPGALATVHIPPKGAVRIDKHAAQGEFPVTDGRRAERAGRRVYMATRQGDSPWMNAVTACDTDTGQTETYGFDRSITVEEHLFVPKQSGSKPDEGWLIGTFFDAEKQRTGIAVFDAQRLKNGPIAVGSMPRAVPLGFHGWFWRGLT